MKCIKQQDTDTRLLLLVRQIRCLICAYRQYGVATLFSTVLYLFSPFESALNSFEASAIMIHPANI